MKKHQATDDSRRQVRFAAGIGMPHKVIARLIGIDYKTLLVHYRSELDEGIEATNFNVAQSLYQNALSGNVTAQIFWMKTRAGWRERLEVEHVNQESPAELTGLLLSQSTEDHVH